MSADRIEALERAVQELAEHAVAQARETAAQAVVARAVVDLLARGGATIEDVRDVAIAAADSLNQEIAVAVRTLLADPPAGAGVVQ